MLKVHRKVCQVNDKYVVIVYACFIIKVDVLEVINSDIFSFVILVVILKCCYRKANSFITAL